MKQNIVLFVVLVLLSIHACSGAHAATNEEHQSAFTSWMHTHGKSYTATEFLTKFAAFIDNFEFVLAHNARTDVTHKAGLNHFSDLTTAEWAATYLNNGIGKSARRADYEFTGEGQHVRATTVDWRGTAVTPIKDQKQCGSCWTFATAAEVESAYYFSTGQLLSLSEQNLLDCVNPTVYTCNGGDTQGALNWVKSNGLETETNYPYTGTQGSCAYSVSKKAADVTSVVSVTSGSESALQAAVTNQPVTVAIDASHTSFQNYAGGIYRESACQTALNQLDHAVVVVGYSTNASGDYWIIKNSWGTGWGDKGWLYLARNSNNMCGVATYPYYATRTSSSTTAKSTTTTSTSAKSTTTTTAKTSTTSTTAKTSTTTGSSSTTGSSTKYIYQDSLTAGWSLTHSTSVTSFSTTAAGYSSSGISAVMPVSGTLTFTDSTAVPITTLVFYVKSTVATTLSISLAGYNPISVQAGTSWNIWTLNLAGVSESGFTFTNTGAQATIVFDNISYT